MVMENADINTKHQEYLQISYIKAICASAGISYETQRHDDNSTDGILEKKIIFPEGGCFISSLRIQLKSTSSPNCYTEYKDYISYQLKSKNFNDLCTPSTTPILLGLLILPEDKKEWVNCTTDELIIKAKMYWADLSNNYYTENSRSKTIRISKNNIINQESLIALLTKYAREVMGYDI